MDAVGGLPWGVITPMGLLLVAIYMVLRGTLVPIRSHERELELVRTQLVKWEDAAKSSEEARREALAQNRELIDFAKKTDARLTMLADTYLPTKKKVEP